MFLLRVGKKGAKEFLEYDFQVFVRLTRRIFSVQREAESPTWTMSDKPEKLQELLKLGFITEQECQYHLAALTTANSLSLNADANQQSLFPFTMSEPQGSKCFHTFTRRTKWFEKCAWNSTNGFKQFILGIKHWYFLVQNYCYGRWRNW